MKVLLVSPNGLHELSGGGLYLRSIAQALCDLDEISSLTIISKDVGHCGVFKEPSHCRNIYLKKSIVRDLASRAMLTATFLATYFNTIKAEGIEADIVLFHNSRCGSLLRRIKKSAPSKRYGIISDNVESILKANHPAHSRMQRISRALEVKIVKRAEKDCLLANFVGFITRADRALYESIYGAVRRSEILPISLKKGQSSANVIQDSRVIRVLFTGHFGFAPNRKALQDYIEVARIFKEHTQAVEFVVAGAEAAAACGHADVTVIDSPSPDQMALLFSSATVYLAPVSWGSGMKTKVAEALSYELPVICMPNAAEGYEDTLNCLRYKGAISVVGSVHEMADSLQQVLTGDIAQRKNAAKEAFAALYSSTSQTDRIKSLMCVS